MGRTGWLALLVTLAVAGLGAWYGGAMQWRDFGAYDWIAYWSVPRGVVLGHGFFDEAWLRAAQAGLGYHNPNFPLARLWNVPPFIVPLLPLGALPFTPSLLLWLAGCGFLYLDAARRLNRELPAPLPEWAALGVACAFLPFFVALFWGQVTPVLAALAVYAWLAQRRGHHAAAGALLVPLGLKPHLFYLAVAVMLWVALRRRQWRLLGTFAAFAALLALAAFALEPGWVGGWLRQGPSVGQSVSPWHFLKLAWELPAWVQFAGVPLGVGLVWWKYRTVERVTVGTLGGALLLSALSSPYLFNHDTVVLLPVALLVGSAFWRRGLRGPLLFQTALNVALMPLKGGTIWLTFYPFMLILSLLWLWATREPQPDRDTRHSLLPQVR